MNNATPNKTLMDDNKLLPSPAVNTPGLVQHFVPCGRIVNNSQNRMTNRDSGSKRLEWNRNPSFVLVLKKFRDSSVLTPFIQLITWLIEEKNMIVFIEHSVIEDPMVTRNSGFLKVQDKLKFFQVGTDDLTDKIDFVICLGGDGTLLYASLLFQKSVPPIIAFHLGSLGFLTPFKFKHFKQHITNVLEGKASMLLRIRLACEFIRKNGNRDIPPPKTMVLNEVVIDRGPSPYLSNLNLYLNGKHITSVQGDGLIISTPTGSTAYAAAAGASIIHPSISAIMITPICPHSLSFRPIMVPTEMELKIVLSQGARSNAWISFDGRNQQELCMGDSLRVTMSLYPVPSVCANDHVSDWFDSLSVCLHWNERKRQKDFEEPSDPKQSKLDSTPK